MSETSKSHFSLLLLNLFATLNECVIGQKVIFSVKVPFLLPIFFTYQEYLFVT